jgi:phage-related protein
MTQSIGSRCRPSVRAAEKYEYEMRTKPIRVFYVATIGDAVYESHCFEKKSQRTAKADIDLGKQRYRQVKSLIDARETP